jgi:hypothetical protein
MLVFSASCSRFGASVGCASLGGELVLNYLPYFLGAVLGLLLAFILSAIFAIEGTAQLLVFGSLPAIGGAVCERIVASRN